MDEVLGGGGLLTPSAAASPEALGASIERLFALCGPSAVLGRVRAVVVDPVDRVFRGWLMTHVGQERHERITPLIADDDASSSVVLEGNILLVVAPRLQVGPREVLGRVHAGAELATVPVPGECGGHTRETKTPARRYLPLRQMAGAYIRLLPAVALTSPIGIAPSGWELKQGHEPTEANASVITSTHEVMIARWCWCG